MRGRRRFVPLLLLAACSAPPEGPVVSAAASLTPFLESARREFTDATGIELALRTGASGSLANQILAGAPTDLFLSADPRWTDELWKKGRVTGSPVEIARNSLVVVVPAEGSQTPRVPDDLGTLDRIALADPETSPLGDYAREALRAAGAWEAVAGRRIEAADARAVLALVERGEVDAAVVYASDARGHDLVRVAFALDPALHRPIRITAALVADARHPEAADRFLLFLTSEPGRALLARHGFQPDVP